MFDPNIDLLVDESVALYAQIKELEEKRQKISQKLRDYLSSANVSVYNTSKSQSIWARPSLSPSYASLSKEEKDAVVTWLYNNRREYLTVSNSTLVSNFHTLPADFPVAFNPDNFVVQVSATATTRIPQPLSEIVKEKVKRLPQVRTKTLKTTVVIDLTEPVVTKPKTLNRLEKIERRTNIIKDWMDGAKMSALARKYHLSAPYISEITRNYEKELVRSLIRRK